MAARIVEKLAPILEMDSQEKYSLKTEPDPIAAIREKYEFTPLSSFYITTDKIEAVKFLKGVYKGSEGWKTFCKLLKMYESPALAFNLTGMDLVVLARFCHETPKAGEVRIHINAKETAIDAYILPFSAYLEFIKTYVE